MSNSKSPLLFITIMVLALGARIVSSLTFPFQRSSSSSSSILGKKSTALEVLELLNRTEGLAAYAIGDSPGTAVVTGGNAGIGAVTVSTLASTGMNVVLCTRNIEAGQAAVKANVPVEFRDRVTVQQLDLADMNSVQTACEQILSQNESIDIIVNNAGVMSPPKRMETSQKLELQFGTNHVGHHMFTRLLLPKVSKNGRIVTVASSAHGMGKIKKNAWGTGPYSPWGSYGESKLSNIFFSKELHDRLIAKGRSDIQSVTLHPGVIATNLWQYSPSFAQKLVSIFLANKSVEQGAATNVYCALAKDVSGGAYYDNCRIATPKAMAEVVSARKELWEYTENLIANEGFKLPSELLLPDEVRKEKETIKIASESQNFQ